MHEDQRQSFNGRIDWERLPEYAPDPQLWPRVLAARQRRTRTRRQRRSGLFALAAAALVVATVFSWPQPPLQQKIAAGQRESQALESRWRHLSSAHSSDPIAAARVRGIDEALQAAYDRGGANNELAPLWQQRNQALRGLIARFQDTRGDAESAVTRI
jgi:hypothetical protein